MTCTGKSLCPQLLEQLRSKGAGFLNNIASEVPRTGFLVYSRGTDTNWVSGEFRQGWIKEFERRKKANDADVVDLGERAFFSCLETWSN
jgi:hypothetical protein